MILGSFNISRGLITLLTECSAEEANLLRTQYAKLFIHLGEHPPLLQMLQRDVDPEIQAELMKTRLHNCRRSSEVFSKDHLR